MHLLHGLSYLLALCSVVHAATVSKLNDTVIEDSVTFFPTHPSLEYHPLYGCIDFRYRRCAGRGYAWETVVYKDVQTGLARSLAFVTDEHGYNSRNDVRQIKLMMPRSREVRVYGAPRSWGPDFSMASQELCIDYWDRPCIQLDVQDTYSKAINEHEPVLIWSGTFPNMPPHKMVTLTLRMTEPYQPVPGRPKYMTLDSVVCSGPFDSLEQRSHHIPPSDSEISEFIIDDLDEAISYRPVSRWNTSALTEDGDKFGTITQASTIYGTGYYTNVPEPEFSVDVPGSSITIWSVQPSRLQHSPGGIRVCLDRACEIVDVFQLYLNLPSSAHLSAPLESSRDGFAPSCRDAASINPDSTDCSVAIWSATGLDYRLIHRLSVTLIEHNPRPIPGGADQLRVLALDYITYSKVLGVEADYAGRPLALFVVKVALLIGCVAIIAAVRIGFTQYKTHKTDQKPQTASEYTPISDAQRAPGGYSSTHSHPSSSTTPPAYTSGRR